MEIKNTKIESFIIGCILGAVPVMFCFVTAWFVSAVLLDEKVVPTVALSGLGVGMVIDIAFLKRWIKKAYQLSNKVLIAIYIFYSIGVLGFCMGVPILNFGVGILAGIYTARRVLNTNTEEQECSQNIKKTALFSAIVMLMMCCITGTWALVGGMIGSSFESPLLSFTFTVPILVSIVLTGGLILSLLQYWLTSTTAKIVAKAGE
ncbi:MAG TPA: hypothetical protein ENH94_00515 [Phycisphaerales bacterium]|nr:hypothetical protein [Phycisphaerales bacterium]